MLARSKVHAALQQCKHKGRYLSSSSSKDESPKKGLVQRLWLSYTESLKKNPLMTKGVSACVIFFVSDLGTQYVSQGALSGQSNNAPKSKNKKRVYEVDYQRALSGSAFGILSTVWLHNWWGILEKAVELRLPVARYRLQNTLAKVFIDQSMAAPLYIYCYYFVTSFLQKKASKANVSDRTKDAHEKAAGLLPSTMLKHWKLWPAVHAVNFHFVPLHHRILVQNMVLVGWSGYLSHLSNTGPDGKKQTLRRRKSIGLDVVEATPEIFVAKKSRMLTTEVATAA